MGEKLKNAKIAEVLADGLLGSVPSIRGVLVREQHTISRVFQLAQLWEQKAGIEDGDVLSQAGGRHSEEKIARTTIRTLAANLNKVSRAIDSAVILKHELAVQETEDLVP